MSAFAKKKAPEPKILPVQLQCEYQTDPVGMDILQPRFSWQMEDAAHTRGQMQTAYHLLVATQLSKLTETDADMWNSGKKMSEQSLLIPYQGKPLSSSTEYFWSVKIYDKMGEASSWSAPARFVTGLLAPDLWEAARWIYYPDVPVTSHVWFRQNLVLDQEPGNIFAHVASSGHHELYVNGHKVDLRVLAPALTQLQKRLFYITYDISKWIVKGKNTIAVWCAPGWTHYDCFKLQPCLKVQIRGKDIDNKDIILNTDESWRCEISHSKDNLAIFSYNNNGGETIDARDDLPDWNTTDFDDSTWAFAKPVRYDGELLAQDIPPSCIIDTIQAKQITNIGDSAYKIDFGKNFTGWLRLRFRGLHAGDTVLIATADDPNSFVDFHICNYFISAGKENEYFQNRFNYISGRYTNIQGAREMPRLEDCTAFAVSTNLKKTGHFISSNTLYQKIYETDLWTFLANTTEGYTSDCPHRERCGYGETATACSWGIGLNNYDAGSYYKKVVRDWVDVQTEDGWGRNTAPQPNNDHWGGALWCSAGMNVAWHHYLHYGDRSVIELIYPTAQRWLAFLQAHEKNGLLEQYRPHNNGQFLGDWLAPNSRSEFGNTIEAVYFNNCVYVMNLEMAEKFARLLGYEKDAQEYHDRLNRLRTHVHAHFYRASDATYCTGTQVQNAFALLTGITPDKERARVTQTLREDMLTQHPYFDMGSSGLTVLLKYVVAHPEFGSIAAKILNKTNYPGYGYFIEQGESTWPEDWKSDVPSKIHTCYTGITGWLQKSLCGIHPQENAPGYKTFSIYPVIVPETKFAYTSIQSPYGKIVSQWKRKGKKIHFSVTIPPNSSAKIYFPNTDVSRVKENNIPMKKVEEILVRENTPKGCLIEAKAGVYHFLFTEYPR
jgi:alpha-L-rhamnosidase